MSDSWALDHECFRSVSTWALKNPDLALQESIDADSEYRPAPNLLRALARISKLGRRVQRTNAQIIDFVKQFMHWVCEMNQAYERGEVHQFSFRTKSTFDQISNYIREIYSWATARLNDARWLCIPNGLRTTYEIGLFNDRISEATRIFTNLSVADLAKGLENISEEILRIQTLQQEQVLNISRTKQTTKKQEQERRRFLETVLEIYNLPETSRESVLEPHCDPNTRTGILSRIKTLLQDLSTNSSPILLLTGNPGSGKTAIFTSVAIECENSRLPLAQCIDVDGDTGDPIISLQSIIRQLSDVTPKSQCHQAGSKGKSFTIDSSMEQMVQLLVDSATLAANIDPTEPTVILIDGLNLDGAIDIAKAFSNTSLPGNIKVLISSPTTTIQESMTNLKHIHIDNTAKSSIQDVSRYIRRKIGHLIIKYDLNWEIWPRKEHLEALCAAASGSFIWAVMATRFLEQHITLTGAEHLDRILETLSIVGAGDLDGLYSTILRLTFALSDARACEDFRGVVGSMIVSRGILRVEDLRDMLDLQPKALVRKLQTFLVHVDGIIIDTTFPKLHKSFSEFITSENADTRLRVEIQTANSNLLTQCLQHLARFRKEHERSHSSIESIPATVRYAVRFWVRHLPQIPGSTSGIAVVARPSQLLNVLNNLGRSHKAARTPLGIRFSPDKSQILTSWGNKIRFWNGDNGEPIERRPIETGSAVESVSVSPDGKCIVSGNRDKSVRLWDLQTGHLISPVLCGHTRTVLSVAFSPDGTQIASGSADKTVRIWDVEDGLQVGSPFIGHREWIFSVAFSPGGAQVASGSGDGAIRIWDVESGGCVWSHFEIFPVSVLCVSFSPDGKRVAAGGADESLRLLDTDSGRVVGGPSQAHAGSVRSVAFSPDGETIVSGGADKTVKFWETRNSQSTRVTSVAHTAPVNSVAFSNNGARVASGGDDHMIRVWDAQTAQPIEPLLEGHKDRVWSVAFSPDGKRVISGSGDKTIRIWDAERVKPLQVSFEGHVTWISAFAFFPDASRVVSASLDGDIQIWDLDPLQAAGIALEGIGEVERMSCVAVSPDGSHVAAVSQAGAVCLWDSNSRKRLWRVGGSADRLSILSLRFSSDGSHIVLAGADGTVARWSVMGVTEIIDSESWNERTAISFDVSRWNSNLVSETKVAFLSKDFGAISWAYVDGKFISMEGDDSMSIFNLDSSR